MNYYQYDMVDADLQFKFMYIPKVSGIIKAVKLQNRHFQIEK